MKFFYPPANKEIVYLADSGFKFIDMKQEVSRFLLEELLPNEEEKRIERMVFQLGTVLDDNKFQKLPRIQLQDGLKEVLNEVTNNGNRTIGKIAEDTGLDLSSNSVFDIIQEYKINDLSSEKVVAGLSKLPTSELEQYIKDIKLEPTIVERDNEKVEEIDFVNVDEEDTPYGTLKLTDEQIRSKIFTNGYTFYYSDFDANKIIPYREEKYEHILSLGFSKVTQGRYKRAQFNHKNYAPFTKGNLTTLIEDLQKSTKELTSVELKEKKEGISAKIESLKEAVKEAEDDKSAELDDLNDSAEELFLEIEDISSRVARELRAKWSSEDRDEVEEEAEELTPMQKEQISELTAKYRQLEKDRDALDKEIDTAKTALENAEFQLETFETDGKYNDKSKLKALILLDSEFDKKMNAIKDAGLAYIKSNGELLKKIQNPLFSYFIELGKINRVPIKTGNKKTISSAVNPDFFKPISPSKSTIKEKYVAINIGDRSSIIPTGGSGKPEKRIDVDNIDEGIQKELNSVISQTRKNFSSFKDLVMERVE